MWEVEKRKGNREGNSWNRNFYLTQIKVFIVSLDFVGEQSVNLDTNFHGFLCQGFVGSHIMVLKLFI